MSNLTIYTTFLEGTEDAASQSGPIFRHPLAKEKLMTGLEGEEKSMYEGFLRGSKKTITGNCLGYRPIVNDVAQPYVWFSYKEIGEMIDKLSSEMMRRDLCPEIPDCGLSVSDGQNARLVGIFSRTRYEWVVAEYACYRCNATVVTLYDTLGIDATKYILKLANLKTIFCGEENAVKILLQIIESNQQDIHIKTIIHSDPIDVSIKDKLSQYGVECLKLDELIQSCTSIIEPRFPQPTDICTICFTSGTTGNPKGVIIAHQTLLALTLAINQHYKISFTPNDVVIAYLPLAHMFERFVEANALFNGACIGYWQGGIPKLMSDLQALRPTAFCAVPRVLQRIYNAMNTEIEKQSSLIRSIIRHGLSVKRDALKYNSVTSWLYDNLVFKTMAKKVGLNRCRWMLTGSAPIADEIVEFMKCVFSCAVLNGYGLTETAGGTCCSSSMDYSTVGHCGGPVCCIEGKLVSVPEKKYAYNDTMHYRDSNDKKGIEVYGRGELCFKGPGVFLGYFKNPDATNACFDKDGWFHTGDIGFVNKSNGSIQIIDRIKNIFKLSQGEYIAVEKIENIYLQNPLIDQLFIYGDSTQNYIVMVAVPAKNVLMKAIEESHCVDEETLHSSSYAELCNRIEVRKMVLTKLNQSALDANLFGFERVRNLHLEPEEWSIQNNMLSPSMKLKRFVTQETYKDVIRGLYREGQLI